jgi:tetratricopeptide (TPR) repeat protein
MILENGVRCLIVIACLSPTLARAQKPGETVITLKRTELKSHGEVITLSPGEELLVKEVKGDLLRVSSVRTGWIRRTDVGKPSQAYVTFGQQAFKQVAGAEPYLGRAGALKCFFRFDEAVQDYEKTIRLDPKNLEAYAKRGECWLAMGKVDKASVDFTKALAIDPDDPVALCGRAVVSMQKGNLDDARRDVEKAMQLAPEYADAYLTSGYVETKRRKFEKAIADFNKAIELRGFSEPNWLMARGDVWLESGNCKKAIDDYTLALRIFPNDIYYQHRAKAWRAAGKIGLAVDDLKAALWTDPSNSETLNALARCEATCPDESVRDGPRAVKRATKACELTDWKYPEYLDTLAAACAENGDFGHAVGFQKKALLIASQIEKAEFEARLELYKNHKPYREKKVPQDGF